MVEYLIGRSTFSAKVKRMKLDEDDGRFRRIRGIRAGFAGAGVFAVMTLMIMVGIRGFWTAMLAIVVAFIVGSVLGHLLGHLLFRRSPVKSTGSPPDA